MKTLLALLSLTLLAFLVRWVDLAGRPMHHDEANQAVRFGTLLESGNYKYDPDDHHGPSLYYITFPVAWLKAGRDFAKTDERTFRLVPLLFGIGLIPLLFLVRDGLGRAGVVIAGLLTAVSPAMVYYSRFYIQEMLLVFFTFGALVAGWRYYRRPGVVWAGLLGTFLALTYATKETAILAWFSMAVAALAVRFSFRRNRPHGGPGSRFLNLSHLAVTLSAFLLVYVLLFTSFVTNPAGVWDSIRAYQIYLYRGLGESLHRHPWHFYLHRLLYFHEGRGPVWTEAVIVVLAAVGAIWAWLSRATTADSTLARFIAIYTLVLTALYSIISHKSPWCLISFLHGMILLAGWGTVAIWQAIGSTRLRAVFGLLIVTGFLHLAWLSYQASFIFDGNPVNPYAYVETSPDLLNFAGRMEDLARAVPEGRDMLVEVVTPPYDTWPIPWYLRRFGTVGYWNSFAEVPRDFDPVVLVSSPEYEAEIPERIRATYQAEFFGLRPNVLLLVYIRPDAWERFIARR